MVEKCGLLIKFLACSLRMTLTVNPLEGVPAYFLQSLDHALKYTTDIDGEMVDLVSGFCAIGQANFPTWWR